MKNNVVKKTLTSLGICLLVLAIILSVLVIRKPVTDEQVIVNGTNNNEVIDNNTSESKENNNAISNTENKTSDMEIVNLSNNWTNRSIHVHTETEIQTNDDVLDDDGNITIPFDEAYPEAFVSGDFKYDDKTVLIKVNSELEVKEVLDNTGIIKTEELFVVPSGTWYEGYITEKDDIHKIIEVLRNTDGVIEAEYNFVWENADTIIDGNDFAPVEGLSNNTKIADQWYLRACGIQDAWNYQINNGISLAGQGSVVAVIDTGVDYNHEDLFQNMWINQGETPDNGIDDDHNGYVDDYYGVDIVNGKGSGNDDNGHGTHVAGIIAGANNDTGIVGVAYNAKVMTVKAGNASGYFLQSDIAKAITYAYLNGADVINMSFGGEANSNAVQDALTLAYTNCVLVAAAGNNSSPNEYDTAMYPIYPASFPYVLGVMSVDSSGTESGFTNYDKVEATKTEYEVYAPGSQITSTIPNNKYATWDGTSMAAPFVSAVAAMVKAYRNDPEIYPTKYIYGQIAGTGDVTPNCIHHRPHNVPPIVNAYNALSKTPVPKLYFREYTIFDSSSINSVNNGDGVIDTGETISLGYEIWNKWGKAKDSIVTISAYSDAGIPNPYVSFSTSKDKDFGNEISVNYGEIGTYTSKDAGKVYDGDVWTGWEIPVYVKISDECPNDMLITVNATVSCKNALDESDDYVYTSNPYSINLLVRNGYILPSVIQSDMRWTSDNYYIISNGVYIPEGVTVNVDPGTKIQFWSGDPNDAYAESAVASLTVNGSIYFNGTNEERIEIKPSELRSSYVTAIGGSGTIELRYCDVTNPTITGSVIENCFFTQTFPTSDLIRRVIESGVVNERDAGPSVSCSNSIKKCVFYKLGGDGHPNKQYLTVSDCNECVFIDSALFGGANGQPKMNFTNCVFYGNNNRDKESGMVSTIAASSKFDLGINAKKVVYNELTGKTYALIDFTYNGIYSNYSSSLSHFDEFLETFNASVMYIDDQYEQNVFNSYFKQYADRAKPVYYQHMFVDQEGNIRDKDGNLKGNDPTLDTGEFLKYSTYNSSTGYLSGNLDSSISGYLAIEIEGEIFITDIGLDVSEVNIDTETSYQITANPYPTNGKNLIYVSDDPTIAQVNENGLITPVTTGNTNIKVYSDDMGVYSILPVNVYDVIDIEAIEASVSRNRLNVGDEEQIEVTLLPDDTTKIYVHYSSSDENIISVNKDGLLTAVAPGTATISVISDAKEEIYASFEVTVTSKIETIEYKNNVYSTTMDNADGTDFYPSITPVNYTEELIWESSNPEVVYVEGGELVKLKHGTAKLRATGVETGKYAEILVSVSDYLPSNKIVKFITYTISNDPYEFVLFDDGSIWYWGSTIKTPQKIECGELFVTDMALNSSQYLYVVDNNGVLYRSVSYIYNHINNNVAFGFENIDDNVKMIQGGINSTTTTPVFILKNDGTMWAIGGSNGASMCGEGYIAKSTPVQLDFSNFSFIDCVDFRICKSSLALYLMENGDLYTTGKYSVPTLISNNIDYIQKDVITEDRIFVYKNDDPNLYSVSVSYGNAVELYSTRNLQGTKVFNGYLEYCIDENKDLYVRGSVGSSSNPNYGQLGLGESIKSTDNQYVLLEGITNPEFIHFDGKTVFVQVDNGTIYGFGLNNKYQLANLTQTNAYTPSVVNFGLVQNYNELIVENTNIGNSRLLEKAICINFNEALQKGTNFSSISLVDSNGNSISLNKSIKLDCLIISSVNDLMDGEHYTLTVPSSAVASMFGLPNNEMVIDFTYNYQESEQESFSGNEQTRKTIQDRITLLETYQNEAVNRKYWDVDSLNTELSNQIRYGKNVTFYNNAILNRLCDDDAENMWLRIIAPTTSSYDAFSISGNYWGTTSDFLIGKQIIDWDDFPGSYIKLNYAPVNETGPSNVWPFVTKAGLLNENGDEISTVGLNEGVIFFVEFNRPMDTNVELDVRYGSTYPYADYKVEGYWDESGTKWYGITTIKGIIESGTEYITIDNAYSGDDEHLKFYKDWGRFTFELDSSQALSMNMHGVANDEGIQLTWEQDDFETLIGYNVYRSDRVDGLYTKLNTVVIPVNEEEFFDNTIEPGMEYYYYFTVVQSDFTESVPSGKITIRSKDTMAPDIYHSPVQIAYTGTNLVINATVTDNVGVAGVKLFYRISGTEQWNSVTMNNSNDKYYGTIPSADITLQGIDYYIQAYDGISYKYSGSRENPYVITVKETIGNDQLGDVNGDGNINNLDALMVIQAATGLRTLTDDQFIRADINKDGSVTSSEALVILKYSTGKISSIVF